MRSHLGSLALIGIVLLGICLVPRTSLRSFVARLYGASTAPVSDVTIMQRDLVAAQAVLAAYPVGQFVDGASVDAVHAPVIAPYPLPYRTELLVAAGTTRGVRVGDVVTLPVTSSTVGAVLFGRVVRVTPDAAQIQTVFDPHWSSAVRVGTSSVDALLQGGLVPRLTLLPKTTYLAQGSIVVSADRSLPYGRAFGVVSSVTDVAGGVFREASVAVPYDLATVRVVTITHAPER